MEYWGVGLLPLRRFALVAAVGMLAVMPVTTSIPAAPQPVSPGRVHANDRLAFASRQ